MRFSSLPSTEALVLLFLIAYACMGVYSRVSMSNQENVFLFHSWSLYSRVPAPLQEEYAIEILRMGDRTFSPPIYANELQGTLFSAHTDYYHLLSDQVNALASAAQRSGVASTTPERQALERNFLSKTVIYRLVKRRYDPVQFWLNGTVAQTIPVATFTSGTYE